MAATATVEAGPDRREHPTPGVAEGPARGPLENYANNSSPETRNPASDLRKRRYGARSFLWRESSLKRVRHCGRVATLAGGGVMVRERGGVVGFAGLQSCGSVWADPVCSAKVMARRRVEIGAAVQVWQAQGGEVGFVTLTMRHRKSQRLATLWEALSRAWGRVTSGKYWQADRARHDVAGWLRVVEVTYGRNGWHVHVHALMFFRLALAPPDVAQLHRSMFGRWSRALVACGLAKPLMVAQDAKLLDGAADEDLARYFTKATHGAERIALEFTAAQTKRARGVHKTRPAWSLLDDVVDEGLADSMDLWHEYEAASKGRRQMTWSQGFRAQLGLGVEKTDDEIAAEELGTSDDDLVLITAAGWETVIERDLSVEILETTERGGLPALRRLLMREGVEYSLVDEGQR